MQKCVLSAASVLVLAGGLSLVPLAAQTAPPPPNTRGASVSDQLTPQMLGEMLRSATTFHDLVARMDLNRSLGPDQHVEGPDGRSHHPLERTVQTIGAGVGAGAAVGAMTRSRNGVLIGALVGATGGLIIDQLLKRREDSREREYATTSDPGEYPPVGFSQRDADEPSPR
jgi:hypothetical protein